MPQDNPANKPTKLEYRVFERTRDGRLRFEPRLEDPDVPRVDEVSIDLPDDILERLTQARARGLTQVFETVANVRNDLSEFFPKIDVPLPARLRGQLVNADGTLGAALSVEALAPTYGDDEPGAKLDVPWPSPATTSDAKGRFALDLPPVPLPAAGLKLRIRGQDGTTAVTIRRSELERGSIGLIELERSLAADGGALSLVSELVTRVPRSVDEIDENPEEFASPAPVITLGESDCARSFQSNQGVIDRFRYSLLVRLVEPQLGQRELVFRGKDDVGRSVLLPNPISKLGPRIDKLLSLFGELGEFDFRDRAAIDRPVDVSEFYEDLERRPLEVPKAGTLGLGYTVRFRNIWIPAGLSLGDLVYSLPLAPGEEQRIVVHEQEQSLFVRESETFDLSEARQFNEETESSARAVFDSALRESAAGGSEVESTSHAWGVGAAGGIGGFVGDFLFGVGVGGGYGSATTSTSSSSWQNASRDFTSGATEELHSAIARAASVRRRATRTGVRLARAGDREQLTTKLLANRNHCHALTIQYWEVLRHFAVSSEVDDVELVCFVPLELIPFLPRGEPRELATSETFTRARLLRRYAMLLRYHDVLRRRVPRRSGFHTGLRALKRLAADPTTIVQPATGPEQEVVDTSLTGTFLPNEDVEVAVVTRRGAVLGPFAMTPVSGELPELNGRFANRDELLQALRDHRAGTAGITFKANVALPASVARNDVRRFEFRRRARTLTVRMDVDPSSDPLGLASLLTVTIEPDELEREVGAPAVWDADTRLVASQETYVNALQGRESAAPMGAELSFSALRLPPILSFGDLLRIEALLHHVLSNTVPYSKAVWMSLTAEERAVMLEPFTIGLPGDGVDDPGEQIPLLNCVANEVLGFYGNAMILPFYIPAELAEREKVTTRDIQEALIRFHRQAFSPPRTSITLPTRGVLGEAVLGNCNACEKIDLTRFWNWKDSPIPEAADPKKLLSQGVFPGPTLPGTPPVKGPSALVPSTPTSVNLVGNITTGEDGTAAPSSNLLEQLLKANEPDTSQLDLTGQAELKAVLEETIKKAGKARSTALDEAKGLASKAMTDLSKFIAVESAIERKEAKDRNDVVEAVAENANSIAGLVGQGDDDAAKKRAESELGKILDPSKLTLEQKAALFEVFSDADGDDDATQRGKNAIRIFLGLTGS